MDILDSAARQIEEILGKVEAETKSRIKLVSLKEIDVTNLSLRRQHLMRVRIELEPEPAERIWSEVGELYT